MPQDFYVGRTVAELEQMLRRAQDRKARGNPVEVTAAGVRTVRAFAQNVPVEEEIRNILYSLFLRDSNTYTNPYTQRITRTRTRYGIYGGFFPYGTQ